jgi:16S rRNA (cytosine(1402)-N(4))-methyltransferase
LNDYIANGKLDIVKTNFRNICAAVRGSSIWKHIRCSDGDDTVLSNNEGGDVHDDSDLKVDGVLMDLGISSFQIDEGARGFAFGADGPLDMRMGKHSSESSLTAAEIINSWDASKIADMLYLYGDERRSRQIAREITLRRPLNTTFELEQAISRVTPYKHRSVTLARCFQAIRIVVNDEISALEEALESVQEIVKPGGKLVILSYHSLEDRRVKNVMKFGKVDRDEESYHHDGLITSQRPASPWATVYKKALVPNDEEIARNRRSRSAKLRIAERVGTVSGSTQSSSSEGAEYTEKRRRKSYPVIGAKQRAKLAAQQHEDEAMVE